MFNSTRIAALEAEVADLKEKLSASETAKAELEVKLAAALEQNQLVADANAAAASQAEGTTAAAVTGLTGLQRATALLAGKRQQAPQQAANTNAPAVDAREQLNRMTLEFDALKSSEARESFWQLNREKISALAKADSARTSQWVATFMRR